MQRSPLSPSESLPSNQALAWWLDQRASGCYSYRKLPFPVTPPTFFLCCVSLFLFSPHNRSLFSPYSSLTIRLLLSPRPLHYLPPHLSQSFPPLPSGNRAAVRYCRLMLLTQGAEWWGLMASTQEAELTEAGLLRKKTKMLQLLQEPSWEYPPEMER